MTKLHPSTALVQARLEAKGHNWAWLGRKINVSPQAMHNWAARGIPAARRLEVARAIGMAPEQLFEADALLPGDPSFGVATEAQEPVARYMSPFSRLDAPVLTWEKLMNTTLPQRFSVEVPDQALAPELITDDLVTVDCSVDPAAGDFVLCRDSFGFFYLREYRARRPGAWVAASLNPSFEPLDSEKDGLQAIGVVVEQTRRRRRSTNSP